MVSQYMLWWFWQRYSYKKICHSKLSALWLPVADQTKLFCKFFHSSSSVNRVVSFKNALMSRFLIINENDLDKKITWNTICDRLSASLSKGCRSCNRFPSSWNSVGPFGNTVDRTTSTSGSPTIGSSAGIVLWFTSAGKKKKNTIRRLMMNHDFHGFKWWYHF